MMIKYESLNLIKQNKPCTEDALSEDVVGTMLATLVRLGVIRSSLLVMVDKCINETKVLLTLVSIVRNAVW